MALAPNGDHPFLTHHLSAKKPSGLLAHMDSPAKYAITNVDTGERKREGGRERGSETEKKMDERVI